MNPPIARQLNLDETKLPAEIFERLSRRGATLKDYRRRREEAIENFGKPGRDPAELGSVMTTIAGNGVWAANMKLAQLRNHWDQVVGQAIASHSAVADFTDGVLTIRTTKRFAESTVSRILQLVEEASSRKSRSEQFITKFARVYTPIVVGAAAVLAVVPPLFHLLGGMGADWGTWVYRALIFLVISCPCALVISIPLSFFAGIGGASRAGVLIKGSNYLETLADVDTVVFDKTGTLTNGTFSVVAVHPEAGYTEQSLLEVAALAESLSDHPIAQSVRVAYQGEVDPKRVSNSANDAGHGVTATIDGKHVVVGNAKMLAAAGVEAPDCEVVGTILHVLVDGVYAGHIVIADTVKADAEQTISDLHAAGVKRTVMLTGDREEVAASVAKQLSLDEFHAQLLPGDKVERVEALLATESGKGKLAFVGDGINDAPVLTRADVGIAMGNAPDFLKEKADYVTDSIDHDGVVTALEHFGLI
mgnify:CR=1 FL=1